jgi:hypothetical protein
MALTRAGGSGCGYLGSLGAGECYAEGGQVMDGFDEVSEWWDLEEGEW